MKNIIIILINLLSIKCYCQTYIEGKVINEKKEAITGAVVFWAGTNTIASTDQNGHFKLIENKNSNFIISTFVGYNNDTSLVTSQNQNALIITLESKELKEIVVNAGSDHHSFENTVNAETIGLKEIRSAACCNLSEAFELNAAVDVIYSDAVSGAKEIKMLGLDGFYTQVLVENQPAIKGLNSTFGLQYIPGQWMSSISVTKGIGSIVNGYEGLTGQINVEYKKPWKADLFSVNVFGTHQGYMEANADFSWRFNDNWSTIALVHGEAHQLLNDFNKDGFADHPRYWQGNISNKWKYDNRKNFETEFGANMVIENRDGGQLTYLKQQDKLDPAYGIRIDTRRYEVSAKTGFLLKNNSSVGIQYKIFRHQQDANFGFNEYLGVQYYANINLIYQLDIPNENNILKIGASYTYENYDERFNEKEKKRIENVPGIFSEYTFKLKEKFSLIAGARIDYNSFFGTFITPRLHLKYSPRPNLALRLSGGKGYRAANIFVENMSVFASNRALIIADKLREEAAWNYGISLTKKIQIHKHHELVIALDYYRTDFTKQVIVDREDVNKIQIYNLSGKSFSNSFQAELNYELIHGLNMKAAFKWDDVWVQYKDALKRKPLVPIFKALLNLNYTTKNKKLLFNTTVQWYSRTRIPNTTGNPTEFQLPSYSKGYINLLAQINYFITKRWEVYLGGENLTNYQQPNAIIDAKKPFSNNFDASLIYGPVDGIRIYVGFRFNLPYDKSKRLEK